MKLEWNLRDVVVGIHSDRFELHACARQGRTSGNSCAGALEILDEADALIGATALLSSICPPGSNDTRPPSGSAHDGGSSPAGISTHPARLPIRRMTSAALPFDRRQAIGHGRRVTGVEWNQLQLGADRHGLAMSAGSSEQRLDAGQQSPPVEDRQRTARCTLPTASAKRSSVPVIHSSSRSPARRNRASTPGLSPYLQLSSVRMDSLTYPDLFHRYPESRRTSSDQKGNRGASRCDACRDCKWRGG